LPDLATAGGPEGSAGGDPVWQASSSAIDGSDSFNAFTGGPSHIRGPNY
jgi:hypothetical protein